MKTLKRFGFVALCLMLITGYGFVQKPGGQTPDKKEKMGGQQAPGKQEKMGGQQAPDKKEKMYSPQPGKKPQESDRDMNDKRSQESDKKEKMYDRDGYGSGPPIKKYKGKSYGKGYKNSGDHKITVCHKTGSHPVTLSISDRAWPAHAAHGDVRGDCKVKADKRLGPLDKKRVILYATLAEAEEVTFWSLDVISLAQRRIYLARLNLETARRSGRFSTVELEAKERRIIQVESRTRALELHLASTRGRLRERDAQIELIVMR